MCLTKFPVFRKINEQHASQDNGQGEELRHPEMFVKDEPAQEERNGRVNISIRAHDGRGADIQ